VARLAPLLLVGFLLAGTAVAFAVTQGLKEERSAIFAVKFSREFGPHRPALLRFKIRRADTVTATVVDSRGDSVRTLLHARHPRGKVTLHWGGHATGGALAPQGEYRLRVRLAKGGVTIQIPTTFVLDTAPPTLTHVSVAPKLLTRGRRVVLRYATNEPGQVILRVDGRRAVLTRPRVRARPFTWDGTTGGKPVSLGRHVLRLRAVDLVGNRSEPSRPLTVVVRGAAS